MPSLIAVARRGATGALLAHTTAFSKLQAAAVDELQQPRSAAPPHVKCSSFDLDLRRVPYWDRLRNPQGTVVLRAWAQPSVQNYGK